MAEIIVPSVNCITRMFKKTHLRFPFFSLINQCRRLVFSKKSMLRKWGYVESWHSGMPCRPDGSPIPWMNYNVIDFLENRLQPEFHMFEFGSGHSSLFFAKLAQTVTSLETEREWFERIQAKAPANLTLIHVEDQDSSEYLNAICTQERQYHVVVVDAKRRNEAVRVSVDRLTDDGVLVLDDSHMEGLEEAFSLMQKRGFRKLEFKGLKAGRTTEYQTTIFYRDGNCLRL